MGKAKPTNFHEYIGRRIFIANTTYRGSWPSRRNTLIGILLEFLPESNEFMVAVELEKYWARRSMFNGANYEKRNFTKKVKALEIEEFRDLSEVEELLTHEIAEVRELGMKWLKERE